MLLKRRLIPAVTLMLTLILGCGGDDPASPDTNTGQTVGPAGGIVEGDGGRATLTIPAGALDAEVAVTVSSASGVPVDAGMISSSLYEFGPDGLAFDVPVPVTITYDPADIPAGVDEADLKLCKATGNAWLPLAGSTVDTDAHSVSAELNGFSTYGPGDPIGSGEEGLSITPNEITLSTGGLTTFTAVQDEAGELAWSVSPSPGGGVLFQDGEYRAPGWPGRFTVTVSRVDDPEVTASATVWVVEAWSCAGVTNAEEYEFVMNWELEMDGNEITDRLAGIAAHGGQVWVSGGTDQYVAICTTEGVILGWLGRGREYGYNEWGVWTWWEGTTGFHAPGTTEYPYFGEEPGQFSMPEQLCIAGDSGRAYVCDLANDRVQVFDSGGGYLDEWSLPDGQSPHYIASGPNGDLFCTDEWHHQVHRVQPSGAVLDSWGGQGEGDGQFSYIGPIAADASGRVFVCDRVDNDIQVFDSEGTYLGSFGGYVEEPCATPYLRGIAVDNEGYVYVAASIIKKFTGDGVYVTSIERPEEDFWGACFGVAVDESGNVYISDYGNAKVWKYRPEGR